MLTWNPHSCHARMELLDCQLVVPCAPVSLPQLPEYECRCTAPAEKKTRRHADQIPINRSSGCVAESLCDCSYQQCCLLLEDY
eukprot:2264842-Amphidinium_carterae.1